MKIGFITDSTCDLPLSIIKHHNIHILPQKIICEHREFFDDKKVESYQRTINLLHRKLDIHSEPCSQKDLKTYLTHLLGEHDYDEVICLLPMQASSDSYSETLEAFMSSRISIMDLRRKNGYKPNMKTEILDSSQVSVGLGMITLQAIYAYRKNQNFDEAIKSVGVLSKYAQTFVIPDNLYNPNIKQKETKGLGAYFNKQNRDVTPTILVNNAQTHQVNKEIDFDKSLNQVLDLLISHIENKSILGNTINIAYGNQLKELKDKPKFKEFEQLAQKNKVDLLISNMSASFISNVGLGTCAIGFLSPKITLP